MIEEEGVRRGRLAEARATGINPYPTEGKRSHTTAQFNALFRDLLASQVGVSLLGRIMIIRRHGGMTFLVLQDESGSCQIALKKDDIGEVAYEQFHALFDRGDFVEISGVAYLTKTEEPTVLASSYRLLTKSLLPLPEKWHGLTDTEMRYRQRYLDLASNPQVRATFQMRSNVVRAIRRFLDEQGFMEVETPILQPIAGGAEAKPFVTHHNALDADLYLRIAPELYLKRCLVGGFERVFEVARCFRNEGISFQHNPEFTQVEGYIAYAGLEELIEHLQGLITACVSSATGGETVVRSEEGDLDFTSPIPRLHFYDLVKDKTGIDLRKENTEEKLRAAMKNGGFEQEGIIGFGGLADELWKKEVRPTVVQPTFVAHYPAAMKPLAKRTEDHPEMSSNVQLVVKGQEILNAFSELNDPLEQEARFLEQETLRERGREEAFAIDHDYLEALKIGMPPAAGYGLGIDRLCAILAGTHNIKEVILFPTLKPEKDDVTVSVSRKADNVFEAIKAMLEKEGVRYVTKHHGPEAHASDEAMGFDPASSPHHEGAKAIVVKGKKSGTFFHFTLPDDCKLDQKKVTTVIGERWSFASPEEVKEVTNCVPGCVPPFGSVIGLVTHMDKRLAENQEIFFNAGSLTDSIRMDLADFVRVESPKEVDVSG